MRQETTRFKRLCKQAGKTGLNLWVSTVPPVAGARKDSKKRRLRAGLPRDGGKVQPAGTA